MNDITLTNIIVALSFSLAMWYAIYIIMTKAL